MVVEEDLIYIVTTAKYIHESNPPHVLLEIEVITHVLWLLATGKQVSKTCNLGSRLSLRVWPLQFYGHAIIFAQYYSVARLIFELILSSTTTAIRVIQHRDVR